MLQELTEKYFSIVMSLRHESFKDTNKLLKALRAIAHLAGGYPVLQVKVEGAIREFTEDNPSKEKISAKDRGVPLRDSS